MDLRSSKAYNFTMSTKPILENFRKLLSTEKIFLVQQLWNEIAEEASHLPLTEAQRRLLDERLDEHEANPDDVEPWGEARDDILRKL